MIGMDDDCLADDFSNEGCLELAMLPPRENADALSDQDSDASDDMNEGLVHHFTRRLLNSACSCNILDRNCDSSTAQQPQKKKVKLNLGKWKTKADINFKIDYLKVKIHYQTM